MKDSEITIISVGPGAHDLITLRGHKAIEDQEIVIGMKDAVETFAKHKEHYIPANMKTDCVNFIKDCPKSRIGVLVSGDAGFFSLARFVTAAFENVTIIPGVSSVCAGFALLKKQWFGYRFMSVHGRELFDECPEVSTIILCDEVNNPSAIAAKFPQIEEKFNIFVLSDISLPSEGVFAGISDYKKTSRMIMVLEEKTA
ncbi:precorrin-6y C5,15-methyltransferase (decarboxylating) subunit CbiE [Seleniivibrio woodruffii]|uniref:precorrin-6y C5,15-methyltransferase (decarboxylating) subunit CbiE n=1 Tax=Seleniivibrio woodruffii TaxID=1078050 RepID=UPI00240A05F1|nr:precorrin-6y C5,15-methyltransferase (decarboxylating) subunit CbiE [Seleniivibrio woodruffii]